MDKVRAHRWFAELVGTQIGPWTPMELLGNGKSAIVVKAVGPVGEVALKLFDPEMVELYGRNTQETRVDREKTLIGADIPHLVKILDGGTDEQNGYLYVAMELLPPPWQTLDSLVGIISRDQIWPIISGLAGAARTLEVLSLAHRDIKPANVMAIHQTTDFKLLDLGVVRPIGNPGVTDDKYRPFIGTLQYSSPEFLLRQEPDTIEGWRAVTFYQLGGILHDLIMRRPLFSDFSEPFARLVNAVQGDVPTVDAPDVHSDLIVLCRNCLLKDPQTRLQCVSWASFETPPRDFASPADAARERVKARRVPATVPEIHQRSVESKKRDTRIALLMLSESVKSLVREIVSTDDFPLSSIDGAVGNSIDTAKLRVTFEPSATHGVSSSIEFCFAITILDAKEKVCRVMSAGPTALMSKTSAESEMFTGVFDHESLRTAIRDFLYVSMDKLQQQASPCVEDLP